jgi:hypothetical protein
MPTTLTLHARHLDTLDAAHLLCAVCEEQPWTQHARHHALLICRDCAVAEPEPDDEA